MRQLRRMSDLPLGIISQVAYTLVLMLALALALVSVLVLIQLITVSIFDHVPSVLQHSVSGFETVTEYAHPHLPSQCPHSAQLK